MSFLKRIFRFYLMDHHVRWSLCSNGAGILRSDAFISFISIVCGSSHDWLLLRGHPSLSTTINNNLTHNSPGSRTNSINRKDACLTEPAASFLPRKPQAWGILVRLRSLQYSRASKSWVLKSWVLAYRRQNLLCLNIIMGWTWSTIKPTISGPDCIGSLKPTSRVSVRT